MNSNKDISVIIYNAGKLEKVLGDEKYSANKLKEIQRVLPGITPILRQDGLKWVKPNGDLNFLKLQHDNLNIILDLSFPFLNYALITKAINIINKTNATYVITHSPNGNALPALIVYKNTQTLKNVENDCFPLMITQKEAYRLKTDLDLQKYHQLLDVDDQCYSNAEQLEQAEKYKDNLGDYYGKDVSHDPVLTRSSRDAPQRIDALLNIETGRRCLDVGCSCGIITAKLAEKGKTITGVEIVPELFEEAMALKLTLPEITQKNLDFVNAPIEECEFESETFDAIYLTETFEHIPNFIHHDLFKKLLKYLKSEGCVVFSVPNRYPSVEYTEEGRHRWDWYNHVTHYTQKSVAYFLGEYFKKIQFYPVYDESVNLGIFLICKAWGKN